MSAITVVPNVIAKLIAIGKPQIIMTLGLRCKINIVIATNNPAKGSILVTNSV